MGRSFNEGDSASALALCADESAIIDNAPPYQWHGPGACSLVGLKMTLRQLALWMRSSRCGKKAAEVVEVARSRPHGVPKNPDLTAETRQPPADEAASSLSRIQHLIRRSQQDNLCAYQLFPVSTVFSRRRLGGR